MGAFRMALRKVVILDGTGSADRDLAPALDVLTGVMELNAHEVQTFTLRILKLGCCIGCFGCWLETPGICIQHNGVSDVAQAIIRSDMIVLFTPVTFGGYSSELKRMLDRFIQFALPYFGRYHGETHHLPRYSRFPRLVAVGVQRHPNPDEAGVFKGIVGRNAINLHTPSHAAEIVLSSDDSATLRRPLQLLLERVDPLPLGQALRSFTPAPPTPGAGRALGGTQRALVIVGSPKTNSLSTSSLLGGWLLNQLKEGRLGDRNVDAQGKPAPGNGTGRTVFVRRSCRSVGPGFPVVHRCVALSGDEGPGGNRSASVGDTRGAAAAARGRLQLRFPGVRPKCRGGGHLPSIRGASRDDMDWLSGGGRRRSPWRSITDGGQSSGYEACDPGTGSDSGCPGRGTAGAAGGRYDDDAEPDPLHPFRHLVLALR